MIGENSKVILGVMCLAGLMVFAACDPTPPPGEPVPGFDKFADDGPEPVTTMNVQGCTLFVGPNTSKPGLTWANGTSGSPSTYTDILTRVASYGTQVTASNSGSTGTGTAVADCVDVLRNSFNVTAEFATSGHSQGGSGCLNAARIITQRGSANVRVTIPVEPDNVFTASSTGADCTGKCAILCGTADNLAPCGGNNSTTNGSGIYNQSNVQSTQLFVTGAGHTGTGSPAGSDAGLFPALVTMFVEATVGNDAEALAAGFGANPEIANAGGIEQVRTKNN